jgi:hypothetical protein
VPGGTGRGSPISTSRSAKHLVDSQLEQIGEPERQLETRVVFAALEVADRKTYLETGEPMVAIAAAAG